MWGGKHGVVVLQLFILRFNRERPLVILFSLIELRETKLEAVSDQREVTRCMQSET